MKIRVSCNVNVLVTDGWPGHVGIWVQPTLLLPAFLVPPKALWPGAPGILSGGTRVCPQP